MRERQLALNLKPVPAAPLPLQEPPTPANSATVYCFEERKGARLAKDTAAHFASILKLISHIK
jgi:hypothetical protein